MAAGDNGKVELELTAKVENAAQKMDAAAQKIADAISGMTKALKENTTEQERAVNVANKEAQARLRNANAAVRESRAIYDQNRIRIQEQRLRRETELANIAERRAGNSPAQQARAAYLLAKQQGDNIYLSRLATNSSDAHTAIRADRINQLQGRMAFLGSQTAQDSLSAATIEREKAATLRELHRLNMQIEAEEERHNAQMEREEKEYFRAADMNHDLQARRNMITLSQLKQYYEQRLEVIAKNGGLETVEYQKVATRITQIDEQMAAERNRALAKMRQAPFERAMQINRVGQGLRAAGTALTTAVTIPTATIGGMAINAAVEREKEFVDVSKLMTGTAEQVATVRKGLQDLANTMPFTYEQIAKTAEFGVQLGIQDKNLKEFVATTLKLGMATDATSEAAATGLAKMFAVMGTAPKQYKAVGSAFVEMARNGNATAKEILATVPRFVAAARAAKLTEGEVLALSNAVASMGQRPQAGGSALLSIFQRMNVAIAKGGDELKGFANVATGGNVQAFRKIFDESGYDAIIKTVAGLKQLRGEGHLTTKMMIDLGFKNKNEQIALQNMTYNLPLLITLRAQANAAQSRGILLDQVAAKAMNTTASQVQIMKNQVAALAADLGDALVPSLKTLLEQAKPFVMQLHEFIDNFNKLPKSTQEAIIKFVAFAAVLGPMLSLLGSMANGVAAITRAFGVLQALNAGSIISSISNNVLGASNAVKLLGGGLDGIPITAGRAWLALGAGGVVLAGIAAASYLALKGYDGKSGLLGMVDAFLEIQRLREQVSHEGDQFGPRWKAQMQNMQANTDIGTLAEAQARIQRQGGNQGGMGFGGTIASLMTGKAVVGPGSAITQDELDTIERYIPNALERSRLAQGGALPLLAEAAKRAEALRVQTATTKKDLQKESHERRLNEKQVATGLQNIAVGVANTAQLTLLQNERFKALDAILQRYGVHGTVRSIKGDQVTLAFDKNTNQVLATLLKNQIDAKAASVNAKGEPTTITVSLKDPDTGAIPPPDDSAKKANRKRLREQEAFARSQLQAKSILESGEAKVARAHYERLMKEMRTLKFEDEGDIRRRQVLEMAVKYEIEERKRARIEAARRHIAAVPWYRRPEAQATYQVVQKRAVAEAQVQYAELARTQENLQERLVRAEKRRLNQQKELAEGELKNARTIDEATQKKRQIADIEYRIAVLNGDQNAKEELRNKNLEITREKMEAYISLLQERNNLEKRALDLQMRQAGTPEERLAVAQRLRDNQVAGAFATYRDDTNSNDIVRVVTASARLKQNLDEAYQSYDELVRDINSDKSQQVIDNLEAQAKATDDLSEKVQLMYKIHDEQRRREAADPRMTATQRDTNEQRRLGEIRDMSHLIVTQEESRRIAAAVLSRARPDVESALRFTLEQTTQGTFKEQTRAYQDYIHAVMDFTKRGILNPDEAAKRLHDIRGQMEANTETSAADLDALRQVQQELLEFMLENTLLQIKGLSKRERQAKLRELLGTIANNPDLTQADKDTGGHVTNEIRSRIRDERNSREQRDYERNRRFGDQVQNTFEQAFSAALVVAMQRHSWKDVAHGFGEAVKLGLQQATADWVTDMVKSGLADFKKFVIDSLRRGGEEAGTAMERGGDKAGDAAAKGGKSGGSAILSGAMMLVHAMALANLSGARGRKKQRGSIIGAIAGGIAGSFLGPVGWFKGAEVGAALGGMFDNPSLDQQARRTSFNISKSGWDFGRFVGQGMAEAQLHATARAMDLRGDHSTRNPAFLEAALRGMDFHNGGKSALSLTFPGSGAVYVSKLAQMGVNDVPKSARAENEGGVVVHLNYEHHGDINDRADRRGVVSDITEGITDHVLKS